ncbi:MAG: hypothetical protein ACXAC2_15435, partial [Candidatus Kariarchaeaceae archaeon]
HSDYGGSNINGTRSTNYAYHRYIDANFSDWTNDSTLTYWWQSASEGWDKITGTFDYGIQFYDSVNWSIALGSSGGTWYNKVGATISEGDTVTATFDYKHPTSDAWNISQLWMYMFNTSGQFISGSQTYKFVSGYQATFAQAEHSYVPSASVDVGFLRLSFEMGADEDFNEFINQSYDNLRLYSSASDLLPVARLSNLAIVDEEAENEYKVSFSISDEQTESEMTAYLYYEDPDDGLYYRANEDALSWTEDDQEGIEFVSGFPDALSKVGYLRVMTATESAEYELHINETSEVTVEE